MGIKANPSGRSATRNDGVAVGGNTGRSVSPRQQPLAQKTPSSAKQLPRVNQPMKKGR